MKYTLLIILTLLISTLSFAHGPQVGDAAPDFEIVQMDGKTFKLSDYEGKQSVYLVFWNSWCTNCYKEIPHLKEIQAQLPDKIKIIAVNTSRKDSVEDSVAFQKKFEINYPLAFDHGKKVTDLYAAKYVPYAFIIDINGKIQHRKKAPEDINSNLNIWNTIEQEITQFIDHSINDFSQLFSKILFI